MPLIPTARLAVPNCTRRRALFLCVVMPVRQLIEERDTELEENDALIASLRRTIDARDAEISTLQSRVSHATATTDAVRSASADEVAKARADLTALQLSSSEDVRRLREDLARANAELEQARVDARMAAIAKTEQDDALYRLTQEKAEWEVRGVGACARHGPASARCCELRGPTLR